jgi:hypothetical protein
MNGMMPLLSFPVTNVIGPRALSPALDPPPLPLLPPPHATRDMAAATNTHAAAAAPLYRMEPAFPSGNPDNYESSIRFDATFQES